MHKGQLARLECSSCCVLNYIYTYVKTIKYIISRTVCLEVSLPAWNVPCCCLLNHIATCDQIIK